MTKMEIVQDLCLGMLICLLVLGCWHVGSVMGDYLAAQIIKNWENSQPAPLHLYHCYAEYQGGKAADEMRSGTDGASAFKGCMDWMASQNDAPFVIVNFNRVD